MNDQERNEAIEFLNKNLRFIITPPKEPGKKHMLHLESASGNYTDQISSDLVLGGTQQVLRTQFKNIDHFEGQKIASYWFETALRKTLKEAGLRKKDFVK